MSLFSKKQGHNYEQRAADYLKSQGFQILAQNFFCKGGELDLVAQKAQRLVFIEVKYRKSRNYGDPSEYVSADKQQKLQRCAQVFLQKNPNYNSLEMRFDVMTFCGEETQPQWIENAFGGW